jgi:Asp/Glu/hydantoin racemase
MSARFVFTGLDGLREEMRALPDNLTGEAGHIVEGAANGAATAVRSAYGSHLVTGTLQSRVLVSTKTSNKFGVAATVKSTAPHATIFEKGTEARHYVTKNGVKHLLGRMPPANIFIPTIIRYRRAMFENLKDLLRRNGLQVIGEP